MTQKRILVIGAGSIGERHVRCFQQTNRSDISLCEMNAPLCDEVTSRYDLSDSFTSFEEAIAAKPEAAVICTPAHLHVPMATQLAEAGIHFLMEKPVSTSFDGVDRLQQVVDQRDIRAAVAYVYRAHPVLAEMRRAIQSQRFGNPVELIFFGGQHFPTYRPLYREIYYTDRATGGGAIQDALTHVVNAGEWLVGPLTRVTADAAHCLLEGVEVEDTVHVIGRHGKLPASYSLNQHQAPNEMTLTVVCERGTVRFESHNCRWRWQTEPETAWHDEPHEPLERDTIFLRQAEAFLDTLEDKQPPLCTLAEGIQTLRANLAILHAVDNGTWETIGV